MAQPPRDVDPSRHSYTGGHFRQRFKNIVGSYVGSRDISDPGVQARMVEDSLADQERKVDAKDVGAVQGDETIILFPTYARTKPHLFHASHMHASTSQHGASIYSRLQVVDVDLHVHGHVSIPHVANAPLRRKDRILLTVARQICGLPPLPSNAGPGVVKKTSMDIIQKMSGRRSTLPTPAQSPAVEKTDPMEQPGTDQFVDEPDLIDMDTPVDGLSRSSTQSLPSSKPSLAKLTLNHPVSFPPSLADKFSSPTRSQTVPSPIKSSESSPISSAKPSWRNSHNFPSLDLATCHANFMERLSPFLARSVARRIVTVKVYAPPTSSSDLYSREIIAQRQFLTNDYGHFTGRLIISPPQNVTVPTTWTVTATLPATRNSPAQTVQEEVCFIPERGISLISDFDDTVKHTSILSGARELFRNTFVRNLGDLYVDGVQQWYSSLAEMGVKIHYVSNSPYQCWPIINSFMTTVGLPKGGSVLLKQYSGMIAGMWENAADKKRAGVDSIVRDFPGRKFILVGDSGEQDLELYTEMALAHRGQILGIFIRDVTTPLLSRSGTSSSTLSLPLFFEGNGQPPRPQGRLSNLKGLRETWRGKSQETIPTLSNPNQLTRDEDDEAAEIERMTLKEIDLLSPLLFEAEDGGVGVRGDHPYHRSNTPPPLPPRPAVQRINSDSTIASANSDPPEHSVALNAFTPERTSTFSDDPSSRVKRVENWKRRLSRAREQLAMANCGVEIWTWRTGGDVESICEKLIQNETEQKGKHTERRMSFGAYR